MPVYEACKFYLRGGKCSHKEAPEPYESDCIGKDACGAWEDDISDKAVLPAKKQEGL